MNTPTLLSEQPLRHYTLHEFVFHDARRETILQWAHSLQQVIQGYDDTEQPVRVLVDASQQTDFPLRYLFECLETACQLHTTVKIRLAYLHHPQSKMLAIFHEFASMVTFPLVVHFSGADDYGVIRDWLLAE